MIHLAESAKGNGKLSNPVGLLTADEIAYAGGRDASYNTDYYLYKNSNGQHWRTSSPHSLQSSYSYMYTVSFSGYFTTLSVTGDIGLRPAVALKSTTKITGLGTSSNPFRVV